MNCIMGPEGTYIYTDPRSVGCFFLNVNMTLVAFLKDLLETGVNYMAEKHQLIDQIWMPNPIE